MFKPATLLAVSISFSALAADLPPDKGSTIPDSAKRPVVIDSRTKNPQSGFNNQEFGIPKHDLPAGYTLEVAAASPLVTHPIMGCLDDRGRLFVGDGVGVNWNKAQLEANPPNRVLMLEDTDHDGRYDKSTIFADKMTFPQGAQWLDGSLYVCSPPGLWKLTDTDNDGVADQREMIVGGFEYTGNAADVHGPFLHPNGRLYWCHGRKGHKVAQKDGTVVHEGLACGIWSCKPDGSDIGWHSLGCGDNPVEVDFTPSGDIIGVQNLYYSQPRGDTLIHWLYGGVYERPDQLKAIAGLPRTLETMPVMYNFGHVAVSGCCFWRSFPTPNSELRTLSFLVTHFNTQRLVRMELTPEGSTYKAVENEFLKMHNPDIHFTDVMEDPRDGSLLLIDTGGWFRIGCPSSLMAKSDILGAVYRIKPKQQPAALARNADAPVRTADLKSIIANLKSNDPHMLRHGLESIAEKGELIEAENNILLRMLAGNLDPSQEHAALRACMSVLSDEKSAQDFFNQAMVLYDGPLPSIDDPGVLAPDSLKAGVNGISQPIFLARMMKLSDLIGSNHEVVDGLIPLCVGNSDRMLSDTASSIVVSRRDLADVVLNVLFIRFEELREKARQPFAEKSSGRFAISSGSLFSPKVVAVLAANLQKPTAQEIVFGLLSDSSIVLRQLGLQIILSQSGGALSQSWLPALDKILAASPSPLLLDAIKQLKTNHFDARLQAIAADARQPLAIRLKALDAAKSVKLEGETFAMVRGVLADSASSAAARIQASGMIASAPLKKEQVSEAAPLFASLGPVELKTMLPLIKKAKDAAIARSIAAEIAKNPAIASQQESLYRTALADLPTDIFETIIHPAYTKATEAIEGKKRQLSALADKAAAKGDAAAGQKHFAAGKGTCIACHKIGEAGRPIGPDLSKIGAIRTERDLLESILFPSNTLSRDYEAHIIETSGGETLMGVIRSHTAEGLLVVDAAGQEKNIPHQSITGDTTLAMSLMPMGLDATMPEGELLDLVAWLRSLK